jgi:uncharacterized protein YebE (UPF0316 family)
MQITLSDNIWISALVIFLLRVTDMSLDTLRLLFVVKGKKPIAWILGFLQSLVFVVAISTVLSNLNNILNIIGYAAGFATGNVLGMFIEERLAIGHIAMRVISSKQGIRIAEALRKAGFAVTEIKARGKDGKVSLLNSSILRRDVSRFEGLVLKAEPGAFITAEDVRPIRVGFWRA